jgi:hypothetical protein
MSLRMAAESKPKAALKRKRRRTPREEYVDYIVEIEGWDWVLAFSQHRARHPIDPYHEFRHLQINGLPGEVPKLRSVRRN